MPAKRDYYEVLEVGRGASPEELRRAYRRLAKQHHPDVNKDHGSEERFKEINEAYAVLSDEERRASYDRFGHAGVQGLPTDFSFGFADIFEEFFGFGAGSRRNRRSPRRGADLRYDLTLDFLEAVAGVEKTIEFSRQEVCPACHGSGAEPGTTPVRCATCNGAGEVRQVRQTFLGSMVNVSTCPACGGAGETIATACRACGGRGQVRRTVQRIVPIPAGVDEGTQVRLAGEGEPGVHGGPHGNLYIVVHVRAHAYFRRRGDDVLLDVGVNVAQATLGGRITVPTVDGEETLTVPAGTQPGKVMRLKAKGIPHLQRGGRGDQLVVISVEIPRSLSPEQRELFEKLGASLGNGVVPQERGFLDRLKDLLGGAPE
ncbi:MAG TPA: molecular chaperone DnaJ [Anaerolineales bacterium]|nr:molecular chaperone DnaJ [Anaerolineales bacterium]